MYSDVVCFGQWEATISARVIRSILSVKSEVWNV